MGYITPGMSNNDIAAAMTIQDRTDYICGLYRKYAKDLLRVRESQRALFPKMVGWCMFDDLDAEVLYLTVRELQPDVSVEVSCGNGWSTSWNLNALKDNGHGHLLSYDIHDAAVRSLPTSLVSGRWKFFLGDIHKRTADVPAKLDFLMMDSEHTYEFCEWFIAAFFPRVRSGGKIVAHDIFALPHPAHGDAIAVFKYLDKVGIQPYSFVQSFPEIYGKVDAVRREIGIRDAVFKNEQNSLLLFDVP